ncbi:hypothetical protein AAZX31_10G206300 [Glycine max]
MCKATQQCAVTTAHEIEPDTKHPFYHAHLIACQRKTDSWLTSIYTCAASIIYISSSQRYIYSIYIYILYPKLIMSTAYVQHLLLNIIFICLPIWSHPILYGGNLQIIYVSL